MPTSVSANLGLLLLRLVLGSIMIAHGLQKWFGLFQGTGVRELTEVIAGQHPLMLETVSSWQVAEILAWLVAFAELGGGLLILVGIFARFSAFWFLVVMAGAIWMVHGKHGFFLRADAPGFEFNLALIGLCLGVLFLGSGEYAVLPSSRRSRVAQL